MSFLACLAYEVEDEVITAIVIKVLEIQILKKERFIH